MKPGERDRAILETLIAARDIVAMVKAGNLQRLYTAQAGPRAAAYDGTPRARGSDSIPVDAPDQPAHDLAHLDRHLPGAVAGLDVIRRVLAAYGPPRAAGEADRLALARENRPPGPTCQHCATVKEPFGEGRFQCPADHRRVGPTNVGGRLPEKMLLCIWCIDFVERQGRLPSSERTGGRPSELEAHRDGRRVMVADPTPQPRRAS